MFYLYLLIAVTGVTILVNTYYSYKRRKLVLTLWDRNSILDVMPNYHETFKYFYENSKVSSNDSYCVDEITWNDLNMNKIFKKINFTFTSVGEELLFYRLKRAHEEYWFDEELIKKITEDRQYRIKLSLILSALGKSTHANSSKYIFEKPNYKVNKIYFLLSVLPIIGVILMFFSLPIGLIVTFISVLINSFLFYITRGKNEEEFDSVFYCLNIILTSRKLAKLNNDTDFLKRTNKLKRAPYISVLLLKDDPTASNLVLQLFTLVKSIFLIDYFVFHYIIKILSTNKDIYEVAWRKTGEIDCCYSVGLWRKTLPFYSLPKYSNNGSLIIQDGYHPLLSDPVGNDFQFNKDILLTGSNASGKSTFIKTIALNIILSQALNTSTSKEITLTRGLVYSSMAMSDDIEKGQSYFLSEISALKRIFDIRNDSKDTLMYLFVDEIFKGTNTVERVAAAESVLNYLSDYNETRIMAATHDLELTDKLSTKYTNFHFREHIINDEIIFDYSIKVGPSKTKNAIELLRITNFPERVYKEALINSKELLSKL
ncbi:MutS-related protein [Niallia sp. BSM11]|uniref:MutS-related protein n=1 Tax=Niallia sp. BSM11 TaxID=3391576 RepID=UPI0039848589